MNFNVCTCLKLCAFPHGSQRFWLCICKLCSRNVSPSLSRCLLCGKLIACNVEWVENNGCKRLLPHPFTRYYPVFSSVKSSVFTPTFCPLICRFINFSYFGFSGAFCSPKFQMTNYQPETSYVKPPETIKRIPIQTGNLCVTWLWIPRSHKCWSEFRAGKVMSRGFFSRSWMMGIILTLFQGDLRQERASIGLYHH